MNPGRFFTLLALSLLMPIAGHAGTGHLAPHQRAILEAKSPPPATARFRFDAPPHPRFTEDQRKQQRERASRLGLGCNRFCVKLQSNNKARNEESPFSGLVRRPL